MSEKTSGNVGHGKTMTPEEINLALDALPSGYNRSIVREYITGQAEEISSLTREIHAANTALDVANDTVKRQNGQIKALADALRELRDLMEDVRLGNYKPDSFTTQPADAALRIVWRFL